MPDQDVMSAIGLVSGSLLEKLMSNRELCSNVMALCALISIEMNGRKASAIRVSDVEVAGKAQMRARVTLDFSGAPVVAQDLPSADKFLSHVGQENRLFYEFVRSHPDIVKWIRQIIEKMETIALQRGAPFAELSFGDHGAFVDIGNVIVLELENNS